MLLNSGQCTTVGREPLAVSSLLNADGKYQAPISNEEASCRINAGRSFPRTAGQGVGKMPCMSANHRYCSLRMMPSSKLDGFNLSACAAPAPTHTSDGAPRLYRHLSRCVNP